MNSSIKSINYAHILKFGFVFPVYLAALHRSPHTFKVIWNQPTHVFLVPALTNQQQFHTSAFVKV